MRLRAALAASVAAVVAFGLFVPVHAATGTSVAPAVVTGSGLGFDACEAPSTAVLRAWSASPYTSVNVYFSGSQRACADQPQLSADWVTTVLANGWSLIPTVVDLQPPCYSGGKATMSPDPATAAGQGTQTAQQAHADLQALGLGGTVAYLDLENFDVPTPDTCSSAVQAYVSAYTTTLHNFGDKSGVYFNANHGASTIVAMYGQPGAPDDIWVADWTGNPTPYDPVVPAGDWPHHQLHQYFSDGANGTGSETYGGEAIGIDRDAIDGDVVKATSVGTPTGPPYGYYVSGTPANNLNERTAPHVPPSGGPSNIAATTTNGSPLAIQCQALGDVTDGDPVWDRLAGSGYYVSDIYTTTTGRNGLSAAVAKCDTTRPVATVRALAPATTATAATVSWSAVDAPDPDGNPNAETRGIATTRLRYRFASFHGGFSAWRTGGTTTARSARMPLSVGYDYCFEAQATDLSGNVGAWSAPSCIARALDDRSLSAGSGWTRRSGSHYFLHTFTTTARTGRVLSRTKAALDRVGVVATTCRSCGAVRVYVGSHYVGTVNLHASSTHYQRVLLLRPFSLRSATVRLVTSGSKLVQIDGVVISRS